jgi:molybdopterin-containing oxidoreductase family membrane subunit
VIVPQAFWSARVRNNILAVVVIGVFVNIGMWFERIGIVWNTLSHGYIPSMWRLFVPSVWDWMLLAGSLGLFAFFYLIMARLIPMVSMHETRRLIAGETSS